MGSDDLYKKRKGLDVYSRKNKRNTKKIRNRILIVCEGEKTEPLYFEKFPINKREIEVKIEGIARNTLSLVKKAIELKEKAIEKKEPYNQI